jgi:hypothetical protein
MFDDILWLCMNSRGGISYTEAYNMPVAYRLLNIRKISEINKKHNEEIEKAQGKGTSMSMDDMAKPKLDIPDFVFKKGR